MARYSYERLSAQDNSFLVAENPKTHMHVTAMLIFDAGPLAKPGGGIDIEAVKRGTEAVMHMIPRYRQRLKWIPLEGRPVWIDDRNFNLDYHIRHTALPRPGGPEELKRLCARIMAQQLDRSRPLWEYWVVEGLQGGRFALITKIHHCMIDGGAGVDLATILMSMTPEHEPSEPVAYIPRPAPSSMELLRDSLVERALLPLEMVRGLRHVGRNAASLSKEFWVRAQALSELVGWAVVPASETPLNGHLGPHRRFDWLMMPLAEVKAVRRAFGCSVNDVILATVAGAVRDFLGRRRVRPDDIDFRVSAPVSMRREGDRGQMGNRVSSWIIRLPIGEGDPVRRVEEIRGVTEELKRSKQALGVETIMQIAEWTPPVLLSLGARATAGPINMIVTNVPGPQFPLYLLGAKLVESYPVVPLIGQTGIGIALFSYDGKLCWGFNGDYELLPDMRYFVGAIERSFAALREAAGVSPAGGVRTAAAAIDLRSGDQARATAAGGASASVGSD